MPITLIKSFLKSVVRWLGYEITVKSIIKPKKRTKIKTPIKVEFLGVSGVGKTTLYKEVLKIRKHSDGWLPLKHFLNTIKTTKQHDAGYSAAHTYLLEQKMNAIIDHKDYSIRMKLLLLSFFIRICKWRSGFLCIIKKTL